MLKFKRFILPLAAGAACLAAAAPASAFEYMKDERHYLRADNGGQRASPCHVRAKRMRVYRRGYVRSPRYVIKTRPAKYVWRKRKVMVSPPQRVRKRVPAQYAWDHKRRRRVVVRQARHITVRRPAQYRWVTRRVLKRPVTYSAARKPGRVGWRSDTIVVKSPGRSRRGCR